MQINEFIGLAVTAMGYGGGITTSVVSLMANVNKSDQAVATGGAIFPLVLEVSERRETVSYFFRSIGSVIGLSLGNTLLQSTLCSTLRQTIQGKDADEVRLKISFWMLLQWFYQIDHNANQKIACIPRSVGHGDPRKCT